MQINKAKRYNENHCSQEKDIMRKEHTLGIFLLKPFAQSHCASSVLLKALRKRSELYSVDLCLTKLPKKSMKPTMKSTQCPMVISQDNIYNEIKLREEREDVEEDTKKSEKLERKGKILLK